MRGMDNDGIFETGPRHASTLAGRRYKEKDGAAVTARESFNLERRRSTSASEIMAGEHGVGWLQPIVWTPNLLQRATNVHLWFCPTFLYDTLCPKSSGIVHLTAPYGRVVCRMPLLQPGNANVLETILHCTSGMPMRHVLDLQNAASPRIALILKNRTCHPSTCHLSP